MGGILMLLSGIFEWALGNSFPATVFSSFGTFWLALAGTLSPSFGAYAFYAPADAASTAEGLQTREFNAGLGTTTLVLSETSHLVLKLTLAQASGSWPWHSSRLFT